MRVFWILAIHDVKERCLNFLGDGAAAARTNFNAVEFADGRHFSGCASEERFVANIDFVACDALLHNLQTQIFGNVEHGVAGDAVQSACRQVWGVDHAVFDHEQILAGAFRHNS